MLKNKVEKSSSKISQMFQIINSSFSATHLHQNFVVLCHGTDQCQMSKFVANFLNDSMYFYMNKILPHERQELKYINFHKTKVANLLTSCRQEVQEKNTQGQCSFALCYVISGQLFCFRSDGVEIFVVDEENRKMSSLCSSISYMNNKRPRIKKKENSYFSADMPKIKPEYLYEQSDQYKKQIYFEKINLQNYIQSRSKLMLFIGCSQIFDLITPEFVFEYLRQNYKKSDCEKANGIIQQAKQRLKTVYNQNLSLTCWKIQQKQHK